MALLDLIRTDLPPLPPRPADGHKGSFGTVMVIGGCDSPTAVMPGAPALAARAALRSGAGLCRIAAPRSIITAVIALCPAATGLPLPQNPDGSLDASASAKVIDEALLGTSCIALGPGLGRAPSVSQLVVRLLAQDEGPVILDADGLNALATLRDFPRDCRCPLVLTPHPGEYRRLAEPLGLPADPTTPDQRNEAAQRLAARLGCIVVLKGANTVVSDGSQCWTLPAANPLLATAGSGDVLTGLIASLTAQHFRPHLASGRVTPQHQGGLGLYDIARWGVALHALAAERLGGDRGVLADELADALPGAFAAV